MSGMYVLQFQRKPACVLWSTCNISMHIILIKRKKREKREENIQRKTFCNTCNIMKPSELARGKCMDMNVIVTKKSSLL